MEGHAGMDMSVQGDGSFWHRLASTEGFTAVSHIFVMEWAAVLRDIVIGLLIATRSPKPARPLRLEREDNPARFAKYFETRAKREERSDDQERILLTCNP